MKIYDIQREIEEILTYCVDENGELTEEAFSRILELNQLEEIKIDNLISFYKSKIARAEALNQERKTLEKREKVELNTAERLKIFLTSCLNGRKFENERHKVTYRKSESVEIMSEEDIPLEFLEAQAPKINKMKIKEALKKGESVVGAFLLEKSNLQIK